MIPALRIAVADDERDTREYLQEVLPRMGHVVVAVAENGRRLAEQIRETCPDLVITDIRMPGADGIETSVEFNRDKQIPVILVSAHHDAELLVRAGVDPIMAYLVKPVKEADLKAAIAVAMMRFHHFMALVKETADLRQALADRKLIEQAKGILIKRLRVNEDEAFRRLRKLANDQNRKMVDVSRTVVEAEDVFRQMDKL